MIRARGSNRKRVGVSLYPFPLCVHRRVRRVLHIPHFPLTFKAEFVKIGPPNGFNPIKLQALIYIELKLWIKQTLVSKSVVPGMIVLLK